MKRITTIVLFASIFAVAVGTLGLSGNATTLMVSPALQTQENVGMLGHVEFKLVDGFGQIKQYVQNDNVVVIAGKDCAAQYLFQPTGPAGALCLDYTGTPAAFTYIGIGNGSSANIDISNQTLADNVGGSGLSDDATGTCSTNGSGAGTVGGGDMARRNVTASFDSSVSSRTVILDTSSDPFTFDVSNATVVFDSGIFNADYDTPTGNHECGGVNTAGNGGDWNMFSRQLLNDPAGITVSDGDSLSVKWTIQVG